MWKTFAARTLAGVVLVYTGMSGLSRFPGGLRGSETALQRLMEYGGLCYGAAGVVAAVALLLRLRWAVPAAAAWGVAVSLTGGLAPVAYGGTSPWVGLGSGAVTALVAAGVVWLARVGARPRPA